MISAGNKDPNKKLKLTTVIRGQRLRSLFFLDAA